MPVLLTGALLVWSRIFVHRLFTSGFFRGRFILGGFLEATRLLFPTGFFAPRLVTTITVTVRLLTTGQLDATQGAAERFDFAFIADLLILGYFKRMQHFFHRLKGLFEGFDDTADVIEGFGDGRGRLLFTRQLARLFKLGAIGRLLHGRPFDAGNDWPFGTGCHHGRRGFGHWFGRGSGD